MIRRVTMYKFSEKSLDRLRHCDSKLQLVAHTAITIVDFSVVETARTPERQLELYEGGLSKLKSGLHVVDDKNPFARAFDILPYPFKQQDWGNKLKLCYFAGTIMGVARSLNIHLIWGGDWDETLDPSQTEFFDAMHFQLKEE